MPLCETQGPAMQETLGAVIFILQIIISCERCSNNNKKKHQQRQKQDQQFGDLNLTAWNLVTG